MDQEPTVDNHEPQYLSEDPVILCGDDLCASLAPTEPVAADNGCPPMDQESTVVDHHQSSLSENPVVLSEKDASVQNREYNP